MNSFCCCSLCLQNELDFHGNVGHKESPITNAALLGGFVLERWLIEYGESAAIGDVRQYFSLI